MEAKFVQGDPLMIDYTPGSDVALGEIIVVNGNCRIPHLAIASGALGAMSQAFGVYDVVKSAVGAVTFADGDNVYWSAGTNLATATSSDTWLGVAVGDWGATDGTVRVLTFPTSVTAGNFTASGTASITGNTTVGGTLGVTGAATFTAAVSVGTTLAVTGAATFSAAVTVGTRLQVSATNTPVAATGSDLAGAAALTTNKDIVPISSDSAAKGVKLPTGVAGMRITIINTSGTAAVLYPASGGTLNGLSASAGVVIAASKITTAVCTAADTWHTFETAKNTAA